MKKLFTLLLIIPILGFSQNDLVFNKVLNFNLTQGQPVTIPQGKAWKIESGVSQGNVRITSTNQEYGNNLNEQNMDPSAIQSYNLPLWLGEGTTISLVGSATSYSHFSVLEFNVVATSSSSSGSGVGVSSAGFTASAIIDLEFSGDSFGIGGAVDMGTLIVPDGKIWKIVISSLNVSSNINGVSPGSGYAGDVYVNGYLVSGEDKPIYLAAGAYQVFGKAAASGGGSISYYHTAKVGGIEYNAN